MDTTDAPYPETPRRLQDLGISIWVPWRKISNGRHSITSMLIRVPRSLKGPLSKHQSEIRSSNRLRLETKIVCSWTFFIRYPSATSLVARKGETQGMWFYAQCAKLMLHVFA